MFARESAERRNEMKCNMIVETIVEPETGFSVLACIHHPVAEILGTPIVSAIHVGIDIDLPGSPHDDQAQRK